MSQRAGRGCLRSGRRRTESRSGRTTVGLEEEVQNTRDMEAIQQACMRLIISSGSCVEGES